MFLIREGGRVTNGMEGNDEKVVKGNLIVNNCYKLECYWEWFRW